MIATGFETRVQIQQIVENQLPEYILSESPKASEFLKQYYISQEFSGGTVDIVDNLDQYLRLDNLTPEVITGQTFLSVGITSTSSSIQVDSTKGFPNQYGLFKIDDEIITYTGVTTNTFIGCVRGFSGITSYHADNAPGELVFSTSSATSHTSGKIVSNLSSLFLKEFYKKIKYTLTPGLENVDFVSNLDVSNFIKESKAFYQSKGTEESFRILFNVLYGVTPKVIDLEQYLLKPSSAQFIRREIVLAERISGDPNNLVGQTIRKSTDVNTQASVSEVEIISRKGRTYYKLGLFVGFDEKDLIEGTFIIPGKTKVIGTVSVGSSVITVDSTIGFSTSGNVISSGNSITYTDKTINQFLNCSGISSAISSSSDLRSDETIYGYENGDLTKKVELRITGVLSEFVPTSDIKLTSEGERIFVKNLGEKILNPEEDKTKKQIFSNSWIYNTSSRYQIKEISGSSYTLYSEIDKSSLKENDNIDVLVRGTQNVVVSGAIVKNINPLTKEILLDNLAGFAPVVGLSYDIRRNLNKSISSGAEIVYGNNVITSDVQNVYNDSDQYFYIASNSLPSYEITKNISKATLVEATGSRIQGYDASTLKYSILSFDSDVPFITGDAVYYSPQTTDITGLSEGIYYVKVLTNKNQIRLYSSRSFIPIDDYIEFEPLSSGTGSHTFTLLENSGKKIGPQKLLKKFPINPNIESGYGVETVPGPVGMLINGVEITNYKSDDQIYYGPIENVEILNSGLNYDVINPPTIQISNPGSGTTCLVRPVISGIVTAVYVDPQDFDIDNVVSITVTGGNGSGVVLQPIIGKRYRELSFDARLNTESGGIDVTNETITFINNHNLSNGQAIVYNKNGNNPVSIGTFGGLNTDQNKTLQSGSVYYASIVNPTSIKLHQTFSDYYVGINTVGFTTASNIGVHKFRIYDDKNTLQSVKVINPGSGYQNRKLIVKPVGISTIDSSVNFANHGFGDGEKVVYSSTGTTISGLSTINQYYVIKLNDNAFRLSDAGIGGTVTSNYTRKNYIKLASTGSGYHNFEYPQIQVNINVEYSGTSGVITATPVVRGSIVDAYVYEGGSGYGSDILNLQKKPSVTIKNGKNGQLKPIINNGRIVSVEIQSRGSEYNAAPDLEVQGDGIGAKLRAIVQNGYISEIIVLNSGVNYTLDKTTIKVTAPGSGAIIEPKIRGLSINNFARYGFEKLVQSNDQLKYSFVGYSTNIGKNYFDDSGLDHSPIIGWAYDGNPIYGPYGYSNPSNENSGIRLLQTGYSSSSSNVIDRPSAFAVGFFVEDYSFTDSGDLDENNGRYCKTPDYPDGVYAYFVGISTNTSTGTLDPKYPYFIGNSYRSNPVNENFIIDQSTFDFNSSNLIRNTFPYKVSDTYADNDFIVESNEYVDQTAIVDSVTKGSVESFQIIESGSEYKIGDSVEFDNDGTNGGGLSAYVSSITGKDITSIQTTVEGYSNVIFIWDNPNQVSAYISTSHSLLSGDGVVVSGLSTSIKSLTGSHIIGVNTVRTVVYKEISSNATAGVVTDVYLSNIPNFISIGSSIGIGTERLFVLNKFADKNIIRVKRGVSGSAHTASTYVDLIPSYLTLPVKSDYFESKVDDRYYFNPRETVGVGTIVGIGTSVNYTKGELLEVVSIPSQSIYLPNHPFRTNQAVTLTKPSVGLALTVSNSSGGTTFNLPSSGNSQTVYIINKSRDYIGIVTQVGLTTSTNGLFFVNNGSNEFDYLLESNDTQVTGTLQKINARVSVSTAHSLTNGDSITLTVNANESVGVGTSSAVIVKYSSSRNKILINPVGFSSSAVDLTNNKITISSHRLKTGDKVFYDSNLVSSGLGTGEYFVYRIDDNNIQLTQTYYDAINYPPTIVSLGSTGGSNHQLSPINPELFVTKNNNLVFDLTDSSLVGSKFKLFYDLEFKNEFVSTGSTDSFIISGVGTIGVSTNASLTLNYSSNNPSNLFYNIERSGFISTSDTDVSNYSKITYVDSKYNGTYKVFGVGTTSFNLSLREIPESLTYSVSNTDVLEYSTNSTTARGGVDKFQITFGGFGYKKLPTFVSIASTTGILQASLNGTSIVDVNIIESPKGLGATEQSIVAINNSNGVTVRTVYSSSSGIVTCVLVTPISGFSTSTFNVGEKIFVEGIQQYDTTGDGFNSTNYDYQFFTVTDYRNTNPAEVEFNLAGLSTNPGIAKTSQNSYASIVKYDDYPRFRVTQESSIFQVGENLLVLSNGQFVIIDLLVTESSSDYIKVYGTYKLRFNETIKGSVSGSIATINDIVDNYGRFNVNYSLRQDYGWSDNIGKLDEDYQVLPDNDYYQSLSYTVKSPIEFENLINPVNRLLHTSGLKNFADTEVLSTSNVSVGSSTVDSISIFDILEEKRVDTINNYDLTLDVDVVDNKSKFLKLKNKKLADYIECRTNRVLKIDDISSQFSNSLSPLDQYVDLFIGEEYSRFLVQIVNPNNDDIQVTELAFYNDSSDTFTFEKSNLFNSSQELVEISANTDEFGNSSLRFTPADAYDSDYDIKVFKNTFNSDLAGISTQSIGFVDLTGVNRIVSAGQTSEIISDNILNTNSYYATVEVTNNSTSEKNFVELYVTHDGTNSYFSEYYVDSGSSPLFSSNFIGTFTSNIDSGILYLKYENNTSNEILVRSKIVGFGTTAAGIGTYRFKQTQQIDGTERSLKLESNYSNVSSASTIVGFSTSEVTTSKNLIRVSYGSTSAIHQVLMAHNGQNTYNVQYPFISIGSTSGIGTFSTQYNGSNFNLLFHPDPSVSGNIQIQTFSEVIYTESDSANTAPDLLYGPVTESLSLLQYDAINGTRANKTSFSLNYEGVPIFEKKFNPSDSATLDPVTGIFTIQDHFFNTGEKLIYTPNSTFVGVAASSVGIGSTLNSVGVVTNILPSDVYAIRINKDRFRISTRSNFASSGIYVTFTSLGSGNAHELEMYKKNEKTLIDIDGIIQSPLAFTPIKTNLYNNGGQISNSSTVFGVTGITSIRPNNIVRIDDEYMKVVSVGFGTTSTGPISGSGSVNLLEVSRAFVGTSATSHADSTEVRLYSGSFNIVGNKIYFTDAPKGKNTILKDSSNLEYTRSSFDGRVYLRNDYTNNRIFDDISDRFTGIGQTYTVTVQGINTTGIQTGSGILLLNGIFQKPSTINNTGNNYSFIENVGVSSVVFTGITSSNGSIVKSQFDVNQNQLPRGGVIVSLGSSGGLGIAPLVGASVTAVVGAGGTIVSVGLGTTDISGSGYRGTISIGITQTGHVGTAASITAIVGLGGTLAFTIVNSGTGYTNPTIQIPQPSYENLEIRGVSRLGAGATTDSGSGLLVTVDVGASSTTGIGSTLFEVTSFKIARTGYGFKVGDVFTPVGLVTDRRLASPINDFQLTVLDVYTDRLSSWEFGEFDYIDSILSLQDGNRLRFPLNYNGQLISFEVNSNDPDSSLIDLNSLLLIFVNGILQTPGESYTFEGGTSFTFMVPPEPEDNISIFFYKGTTGTDSISVSINETIKVGDAVQVFKNNNYPQTIDQNLRTIYNTTELFVDDAQFFNYEENNSVLVISSVGGLIVTGDSPVAAGLTAVVSAGGTIQSLSIVSSGSGYVGSAITVSISAPPTVGVGVGTTATATATITNGQVTSTTIVNQGFGYSQNNPPQVLSPLPTFSKEDVNNITTVEGFAGIITGISTTSGTSGNPLALKFNLNATSFVGLVTGYPLYIFNTSVGSGVTSIDGSNSAVVGIGTTFLDNIYYIHSITSSGSNSEIVANVHSSSNIIGINTSGSTSQPIGRFSWGRLSGFNRSSNPISLGVTGFTIDAGLSTFPSIQRRDYGLRDSGALRKDLG